MNLLSNAVKFTPPGGKVVVSTWKARGRGYISVDNGATWIDAGPLMRGSADNGYGYNLGGEQSGHIIFADHLFTGDGLATALNVLRVPTAP